MSYQLSSLNNYCVVIICIVFKLMFRLPSVRGGYSFRDNYLRYKDNQTFK